jgi:hypothetical protein
MEMRGIDPRTSRMLSERSTIWATSPAGRFKFWGYLFLTICGYWGLHYCSLLDVWWTRLPSVHQGTGSTERLLMSSMLDPHEGSPSAIMQAWTCKSESNNAAMPRWNRPASCNKTPHACPSFPWMMQIAEQVSKKTPAYAYCIFQTQNGPAQIKWKPTTI